MKGKTISLIRSKDFKGLIKYLFRKHVIDSMGLSLASFIFPPLVRFLAPTTQDTRIHGLFEMIDQTDITDHLPVIFSEAIKSRPSLMVELGTRGGDSTKVLLRAASITMAKMLSVDIEDCSHVVNDSFFKDNWRFVQADDVVFAGEFKNWCLKNGFPASIDLLFIDTSHEYEHTIREINAWFPLLSARCKVILHDTNMRRYFKHKSGRIVLGWDNKRGVIRAIEETLGRSYNEAVPFIDLHEDWLIEHHPHSNGLTILTRW